MREALPDVDQAIKDLQDQLKMMEEVDLTA
jgi:hypothetical protein